MKSILISIALVFLSGCASVTGSKTQPVTIQAICDGQSVNGASCTLSNDKSTWYLKTPGSVVINKSTADLSVTCKYGQASQSAVFQSKSNGGVWGNILAGGIIGYAVDANTGAGFDYPQSMTVTLSDECKTGVAASASNPTSPATDTESKLKNLQRLFDQGLITKEEFTDRRKQILSSM